MFQTALDRATHFLLRQAEAGFPESCHTMIFPRAAGFSAANERQASDLFARAVLAGVWLDCAALGPAHEAATWRAIARREADYLAQAKLTDRAGGWSYFPDLPELPPDVDSLAAVQTLFARVAPDHLPLCLTPTALALQGQRADGGLTTWLVAEDDPAALRERMQFAIGAFWGDSVDVDVCARFYLSLWLADNVRYGEQAWQGAAFILSQQQADGCWPASWYWGRLYSSCLCLELLAALKTGEEAQRQALAGIAAQQRPDGGWGVWQSTPLDTAVALWVLGRWGSSAHRAQWQPAAARLLDWQGHDGRWVGTPWIKMEIGRAQGQVGRTATYQSDTLTTAFCLRALRQMEQ